MKGDPLPHHVPVYLGMKRVSITSLYYTGIHILRRHSDNIIVMLEIPNNVVINADALYVSEGRGRIDNN